MKKCKAKGCKQKVKLPARYCSYECACYDGKFSVVKGWKKFGPVV